MSTPAAATVPARYCENWGAALNGRSLQEALYHNMPRAMFLFPPLLAGAMMLALAFVYSALTL
jgi:hypothetical protein